MSSVVIKRILSLFLLQCVSLLVFPLTGRSQCPSVWILEDPPFLDCNNPQITLHADAFITTQHFNGTYRVESIPYDPPEPFTVGEQMSLDEDDRWDSRGGLDIDFPFQFFGVTQNHIFISVNGLVSFNNTITSGLWSGYAWDPYYPIVAPTSFPWPNSILGVACDMDPRLIPTSSATTRGVFKYSGGEAPCRHITVSWNQVPVYGHVINNYQYYYDWYWGWIEYLESVTEEPGYNCTHQVVLYEGTNVVEVHVKKHRSRGTASNGTKSAIGIINADGSSAFMAPGRNPFQDPIDEENAEAWRFTPLGTTDTTVTWYRIMGGDSIEVGNVAGDANAQLAEAHYANNDHMSIVAYPSESTDYKVVVRYTGATGQLYYLTDLIHVEVDKISDYTLGSPNVTTEGLSEVCYGAQGQFQISFPTPHAHETPSWQVTHRQNGTSTTLPASDYTLDGNQSTLSLPSATAVPNAVADSFLVYSTVAFTNGCVRRDSLLHVVHPIYDIHYSGEICDNQFYSLWGEELSESGPHVRLFQTAHGCDSVETLTLNVLNRTTSVDEQVVCDTYTWMDGNTYTESVQTPTFIIQNSVGCDSTITLNLTVRHSNAGVDVHDACDTYTWVDGNTYTASTNVPTYHTLNAAGCDSTVTLHLVVRHSTTAVDPHDVCDTYTWIDGRTYTRDTILNYQLSTLNSAGCDSTVALNLLVRHSTTGVDPHDVCDTYTWMDGNTYTESVQTPTFIIQNFVGCDSTITLNLIVRHSNAGVDVQDVCDTYTWVNGTTYTESTNTPTYLTTNAVGCDSTATLHLIVRRSTTGIDPHDVCDTYTWVDGNTYTASTSVPTYHTLNDVGCDSTITLNLVVRHSTTGVDPHDVCDTYTWIDGNTYTHDTILNSQHSILNSQGCDSTVTLHLVVRRSTTGVDPHDVCDTYTWIDGNTYTHDTILNSQLSILNSQGCDSTVTLNLIVRHSTVGIDFQNVCDSLTWIDGHTYTHDTILNSQLSILNSQGCDSTVTLNLVLRHSTAGVDRQTACDTYTWIDDNTYTASVQNSTFTIPNSVGCDSLVTLNLTVYYSFVSDSVAESCSPFVWTEGQVCSTTGDYRFSYASVHGCDSVCRLHFTRYHDTVTDFFVEGCDSVFLSGVIFRQDTVWVDSLTSMHGCDSVVTVHVFISPSYRDTVVDSIPEGLTYTIEGHQYTDSGNYLIPLVTSRNCDSLIVLMLSVYDRCNLYLQFPNLITPNGDGVNDRFVVTNLVEGGCYPVNRLTIYDRWGKCVHDATNITCHSDFWDPAAAHSPTGTYFYIFRARNHRGHLEHRGTVEVIY